MDVANLFLNVNVDIVLNLYVIVSIIVVTKESVVAQTIEKIKVKVCCVEKTCHKKKTCNHNCSKKINVVNADNGKELLS